MGLLAPPAILPYRGYGTASSVWLKGHVLDDRRLYEAQKGDRKRKNIMAMVSRYMSDPLPNLDVEVDFLGKTTVVKTDDNGFFQAPFEFSPPLAQYGWLPARYRVLDKIVEEQNLGLVKNGEVYVVDERCEYGVISDVDDTILVSHATELLKKMRLILTKNSLTRLPFPGIVAFYHALHEGTNTACKNPIFYVSSSEWNLYDFLVDFCRVRDLPKGVFLLQDLKKNLWQLIQSGGGNHEHKLHKLRHLFDTFPNLNFILVGDSGQRDASLYAQVVQEYPGRVLAIYIRDVSKKKREQELWKLSDSLRNKKVEMLLVANTLEAAKHAFEKGFITEVGLRQVEGDFE